MASMQQQLPEDQELIRLLLQKSELMFSQVVEAYHPSLYGIARAIAGEAIADEVIQEAWVSAIRALPKFEGRSSFKSWLSRIVINEARSRIRKEKRQVALEDIDAEWAQDPRFNEQHHWAQPSQQWHTDDPQAMLIANELKDCLDKHIKNLSDNQEAVLALRDIAGLSLDDICSILDLRSSNVRVLLHRARDKMLQMIDRFERLGIC